MKISRSDLVSKLLYTPLVFFVLSIIAFVVFIPQMFESDSGVQYIHLTPIILVVLSIIFFVISIVRIKYGITLLGKTTDIEVIKGKVFSIRVDTYSPRFNIDDKKYRGKIITMDGIKYFIVCGDDVIIGSQIEIRVFRGSRVVIEWDLH